MPSKKLLISLGLIAVASTLEVSPFSEAEREFLNFIAKYRRSYGTKEEYNLRFSLFEKVYNDVQTHNANPSNTYKKGINELSDLTEYEFNQRKGYKGGLVDQKGEVHYGG